MGKLRSELLSRLEELTARPQAELCRRIETNEEFREMFLDYRQCWERLREWKASLNRDQTLIGDYEQLSEELEQEIVSFLRERLRAGEPPEKE